MRRIAAVLILLLLPAGVFAGTPGETVITIPDVSLIDQHGKPVRFYGDLVKGRIVVMNFIFTSCTTICSPMGANFAALQKRLGDRRDVALISVSIDPGMDTPARLKSWSARFHAQPGWTLVTGRKSDIDRLLKGLRVYSANPFSHAPVAIVGSDATGRWERVSGLLPADKMAGMIKELTP